MELNDSSRVRFHAHPHSHKLTLMPSLIRKPNADISVCQAVLLSSDGQNLVTGGDNGVVEVWQACDFKQLYIYPGCDAGIRAMDLSHDQR